MYGRTLQLRVDPPYQGESLSSFLERAAQFYGTRLHALLHEVMQGYDWSSRARRDLDTKPPSGLLEKLADATKDWRSPLEGHDFRCWTLAPIGRTAYCPLCFSADLAAGRTPYFRNDWMAVFVTHCWKHRTPLFQWIDVYVTGFRKRPKSWVRQMVTSIDDVPDFFWVHNEMAQTMLASDDAKELGPNLELNYLANLQRSVIRPLTENAASYRQGTLESDLRHVATNLVTVSSRYLRGCKEEPIAVLAKPDDGQGWFGGLPVRARRRTWSFSEAEVRQTTIFSWRRTYLYFAARTLAGTDRFGEPLGRNGSSHWRDWWNLELRRRAGSEQRAVFDYLTKTWGPVLDRPHS